MDFANDSFPSSRVIERRKLSASLTPTKLHIKNIVYVAAGAYHSFAVNREGVVYAWGLNAHRQAGVADEDLLHEGIIMMPTEVRGLDREKNGGSKVVSIACGMFHSLFLFDDGRVLACGSCIEGRLGLGDSHPAIAMISRLKADVKEQRKVWTAGETERLVNSGTAKIDAEIQASTQAAHDILMPDELVKEPTQIAFPVDDDDLEKAKAGEEPPKIVRIASNSYHSFAVSSKGDVYAFGYSGTSTLGLGNEELINTPKRLKFPNIWKKDDVVKYIVTKKDKEDGWQEHKVLAPVIAASTGGQHSVLVTGAIQLLPVHPHQ